MRAGLMPILMPSGLPMRGLEGAWLMAAPNLLINSNTVGDWSAGTGAYVVATAAVTTPGGAAALKIVENDGAATFHWSLRVLALITGETYTFQLKAKAAERNWLTLAVDGWMSKFCYFDLANGAKGTVAAGTSSTMTALGDGWYLCTVTGTADAIVRIGVGIGEADNDRKYDGGGTAPYTEDDPGIYIAEAGLNRGSTLLPYTATTTLQTFPSLYAKTPTLTRGADANAATDDPTLDGWGWVFDGTKFGRTGNLTIPIAGPFTAYIAALFTGTSGYILSFGADADNYHSLYNSADNAVGVASKDAGGETTSASALTTADTDAILISLRSDGITLTACREDTGAEVTLAAESAAGTALLAVGSLPNGGSPVSGQTTYAAYIVGRTHNRSERQRVRRAMRSKVYADTNGGVSIL